MTLCEPQRTLSDMPYSGAALDGIGAQSDPMRGSVTREVVALADALCRLQAAARTVAELVARQPAARVTVLGDGGRVLLDFVVPAWDELPAIPAGWAVTARSASFDGAPVPIPASRLRLLKALVEAEGPITAKELTRLAFDQHTDETNTRYHIRELKRELAKAFAVEGDIIQGGNDGYRLALR